MTWRAALRWHSLVGARGPRDPVHPDSPLPDARAPALPARAVQDPGGPARARLAAGDAGQPGVRLRRSGLEAPLAAVAASAVLSVMANPGRVAEVSSYSVKAIMYLASFFLLVFLIVSVVRQRACRSSRWLVAGGAVVAVFAMIESRTNYNVFDHVSTVLPFLTLTDAGTVAARGARLRVLASSQHPIALGAMFVMLIPLAAALAVTSKQRRWWYAAGFLGLGALATVSRTTILMLVVIAIMFAWMRPRAIRPLWPALIPLLHRRPFRRSGQPRVAGGLVLPLGGHRRPAAERERRQRPAGVPRAVAHRAQAPTGLRRGLRDENRRRHRQELDHRRRSVADEPARDGRSRGLALGLAVRQRDPKAAREPHGRTTRAEAGSWRRSQRRSPRTSPGCSPTTRSRSSR